MNVPIVFLDIDGVLQPLSSQDRFNHDLDELQERLATEVDPGYRSLHKYDIAAVQHDWHPPAIEHLKALCEQVGAQIVVSSAWREGKSLQELKLLFRIHTLDPLIIDATPELHSSRDLQIQEYLGVHPEIQRFVIIDDGYVDCLRRRFPDEFVYTSSGRLDGPAYEAALSVLRRRVPHRKYQARLARIDSLLARDPDLLELRIDLADIGLFRRLRRVGSLEFLGLLCEAVADCPNLARLTVRGLRHDFTYPDETEFNAVGQVRQAAQQNPAIQHLDLQDEDKPFR